MSFTEPSKKNSDLIPPDPNNSIVIGRPEGYKHRHFCFYCGKFAPQIWRHLKSIHKKEKEVVEIVKMNSMVSQDSAKEALIHLGDHVNNLQTLEEGKGFLIVGRTQNNVCTKNEAYDQKIYILDCHLSHFDSRCVKV